MHRLVLDVNDSVMDKIVYFLNHLPQKDVKIVKDEVLVLQQKEQKILDFSNFHVNAFKNIDDPVAWQKKQREEWK